MVKLEGFRKLVIFNRLKNCLPIYGCRSTSQYMLKEVYLLLQLDLTLHCLLYLTSESYLGLGVNSLYVVSANYLLTLTAVSALSLHFLELFSFSMPLLSFYKLVQNFAAFSVSSFIDK